MGMVFILPPDPLEISSQASFVSASKKLHLGKRKLYLNLESFELYDVERLNPAGNSFPCSKNNRAISVPASQMQQQ